MLSTRMSPLPMLHPVLEAMLADPRQQMAAIDAHSRTLLPENPPIIWECDAATFGFSFVGQRAPELLDYPRESWLEAGFWAEQVVASEDRDDAIAYCALATAQARDHMFEYRARAANGRIVWMRDFVKVLVGERGITSRLRGAMFDISDERSEESGPPLQHPSREELGEP